MLGREWERLGRVRVEKLAREDEASSRLLDTHWDTWRLTERLVDGRGGNSSTQGTGTDRGCS